MQDYTFYTFTHVLGSTHKQMDLSDIDDYDFNINTTEIHRADGKVTKNIHLTIKKPINLPLIIVSVVASLILIGVILSIDQSSIFPLSTLASLRDYLFDEILKPFSFEIYLAIVNILLGALLAVRVKMNISDVVNLNNGIKEINRKQEDLEYLALRNYFLENSKSIYGTSHKKPPSYRTKRRQPTQNDHSFVCKCGSCMMKLL